MLCLSCPYGVYVSFCWETGCTDDCKCSLVLGMENNAITRCAIHVKDDHMNNR